MPFALLQVGFHDPDSMQFPSHVVRVQVMVAKHFVYLRFKSLVRVIGNIDFLFAKDLPVELFQ